MQFKHEPLTAIGLGNRRSIASCAIERRSLKHGSDQASKLHHSNDLNLQPLPTTVMQPPTCTKCSESSQILQAYGEMKMSALAAGKRQALT